MSFFVVVVSFFFLFFFLCMEELILVIPYVFINRPSVIPLLVGSTIKSAVIIGILTKIVQPFDKEFCASSNLAMAFVTSRVQVKSAFMMALTVNRR